MFLNLFYVDKAIMALILIALKHFYSYNNSQNVFQDPNMHMRHIKMLKIYRTYEMILLTSKREFLGCYTCVVQDQAIDYIYG